MEATTLHSDLGKTELMAALKRLDAEFNLSDASLYACLNGDYCVTRVVAGETERVQTQLRYLEQRSDLYLSLGHGKKTVGGSVRQIDARHEHALLTVVNQKTVDALMEISTRLGLRFTCVEPSLVALSRFVGQMGADEESPKLIVSVGEFGLEVGISQKGQLLLDYRPANQSCDDQVAHTITGHLGRLQRYCNRYVSFANGNIDEVFLCGPPNQIEEIGQAFLAEEVLTVSILDPASADSNWKFEGDAAGPEFSAAIGTFLYATTPRLNESPPNVMERILASVLEPLGPACVKTFWPVAAAVLLWVGAEIVAFYQGRINAGIDKELSALELQRTQLEMVDQGVQDAQTKILALRNVSNKVVRPQWHDLTAAIGRALPADVWLESIELDTQGRMTLTGASKLDDGAFEFERALTKIPELTNVSIGGTKQIRIDAGQATRFDVHCDLNGFAESNNDHKSAG